MKCLSWNCWDLRKARTVHVLSDLIRDRKPEMLFLMETISVASKIEDLRIKLGFSNYFSS